MINKEYLGQGLKYPFQFQKGRGSSEISTSSSMEHEHIRESMIQILETPIGERFMNPEFGSRIKELLFENNTDVLKSLLRYHIGKALKRWEKRIELSSIEFSEGRSNKIIVLISYKVIRSQVEGNLIYPFKRLE